MNVMVADYKNKMACVLPRLRKIEEALKEKTKKYRKAKKEMGHAEKVTGQRGCFDEETCWNRDVGQMCRPL
ncbi:hypothetical protein F2Q68_00031142 [Brassica cretica]|uniref:Uncharacterized protein n=1 Tax=Brassica cretica TaxID=69181 RepID=A0A8S9G7E6_BRACR|nr:hypothetical protein F2Q68_00031142 [Brassica cretica]